MKVIDMHCDTITKLYAEKKLLKENDCHIDLKRLVKADYAMQCFAMFVYLKDQKHPYQMCKEYIAHFKKEMALNQDIISQVTSYDQLIENMKQGKLSALLTIEEGGVLEGSLDKLKSFYDDGVGMLTLTWNFENELGYPNIMNEHGMIPNTEKGLKDFGREVVAMMNQLGMIVDVSHGSDRLIEDVLAISKKPIVASHSNARSVRDFPRNLTDEMIVKLADNGGMTGINFCPNFISTNPKADQLDDIVRQIKHITNIGGYDVCGLGSDFDGIPTPVGMSDCSKMPLLIDKLVEAKFTQEQIEKIFYRNFLRVFEQNCR